MGYDRSSVEISFAQLTGDRCSLHAFLIYRGGNWQIDDVRYRLSSQKAQEKGIRHDIHLL
jgi:hypothetical protein